MKFSTKMQQAIELLKFVRSLEEDDCELLKTTVDSAIEMFDEEMKSTNQE